MSWNVEIIGKPVDVVVELQAQSARETGQCKVEFDAALPHMIGLVKQNFVDPSGRYYLPLIRLYASGSGICESDKQVQRNCTVKVEPFYGKLV